MIGKTNSVIQIETGGTGDANGFPIDVSDPAELTAAAITENAGKLYRYTGAMTDTYTQNALYMTVNDEEVV